MAKKASKKVVEATKKALEVFDRILDIYEAPDFVEIIATVGGDVIRRRYYDNGMECDK